MKTFWIRLTYGQWANVTANNRIDALITYFLIYGGNDVTNVLGISENGL